MNDSIADALLGGKGKFNRFDSVRDALYGRAKQAENSNPYYQTGRSLLQARNQLNGSAGLDWKQKLAVNLLAGFGGGALESFGRKKIDGQIKSLQNVASGNASQEELSANPNFASQIESINNRAEQERKLELEDFSSKEKVKAQYKAPHKIYNGEKFNQVNPVTGEVVGHGLAHKGNTTNINVGNEKLGLKDRIQATNTLSSAFVRDPAVTLYNEGKTFLNSLKSLANSDKPVSDHAFLVNTVKFNDVNSAVLGSEAESVRKAIQSLPENIRGTFNKALFGGTSLTKQNKLDVVEVMEGINKARQKEAFVVKSNYNKRALATTLDPELFDPYNIQAPDEEREPLKLGQDVGDFQKQQASQETTQLNGKTYIKVKGGWEAQ